MLEVRGISAGYKQAQVLFDVSFEARAGEITCLLGRNGAGKSTTLQAIMGLLTLDAGEVVLDGQPISRLPAHQVPSCGVGYVPQGRRLFAELTVEENLSVGLLSRGGDAAIRSRVLGIFPRLAERLGQVAGTLSGGEQQMLATARALCLEPQVLLLDEPTEGLQPSMIAQIREVTLAMREAGLAVVLVEQRIDSIEALADRAVFLENGRVVDRLDRAELSTEPGVLQRHLGV